MIHTFVIIYCKLEKRLYDVYRAQSDSCELFVLLIGRLPEIRQHRKLSSLMNFHMLSFGPLTRVMVHEPHLLAHIFHRNPAQNYSKSLAAHNIFSPIIVKITAMFKGPIELNIDHWILISCKIVFI
jgi:hypothetical protein